MNKWRKKQKNYSIHNSFKKLKHLGINLTKVMKDLYNENDKRLKKEIEEKTLEGEKAPLMFMDW
jgi:hypothetical protein